MIYGFASIAIGLIIGSFSNIVTGFEHAVTLLSISLVLVTIGFSKLCVS